MPDYELKPRVHNITAEQITKAFMRNKRDWPAWFLAAWQKESTEVGAVFSPSNDATPTDTPLMLRRVAGERVIEVGWRDYLIDAAGSPIHVDRTSFERKYQLVV